MAFGEFAAWRHAHTYDVIEWMVIPIAYLALGALLLDLAMRFAVHTWRDVLMLGGLFGVLQNAVIALDIFDYVPASIVLYGTGLQTLMFVIAWLSMHTLYQTDKTWQWSWLVIAGGAGIASGIWTRWYPEIDAVSQPVPDLIQTLPITLVALTIAVVAAWFLPIQTKITAASDWKLNPVEQVSCILYLGVLGLQRISTFEAFEVAGAIIALALFIGLMVLLWYAKVQNPVLDHPLFWFRLQKPVVWHWGILVGLLGLFNAIGYAALPAHGDDPLQSQIVLIGIAAFGILWIPLVSTWIGFQVVMRLAEEEY